MVMGVNLRFRRIGRVAALVAALPVAILALSLDRVDHRPYLREPYFAATASRLQGLLATNQLVSGTVQAGFGRARLTPALGSGPDEPAQGRFRAVPLAGYGDRRGRSATGTHDDLYIKAVALRVAGVSAVMVSAEALIIPREVAAEVSQRVQQELGLSRAQLYFGATHTHASLGGWGEGVVAEAFAGEFQPGLRAWFIDRLVSAVRQAMADLQPASLGHGRFTAPHLLRNRLVGDLGQIDPEFSYLALKQEGGRLGVIGSYAAHATVLSSQVMEFSGDYPGCWQRAIEEATGGHALFLAGAVGSHSPVPGDRGFAGAEKMGGALATALLSQLPLTPLTNRIRFSTLGLETSLPPLNVRLSDGIRLRPWLAQRLLRSGHETYLQALLVDDTVWISTPCDFSGELALELKDSLRARHHDAVVTSFNGDYVGYVIPARYYHLAGYEPRVMSFFGPNVPDYFCGLIKQMALSYLSAHE
jgi:hypothetical protein